MRKPCFRVLPNALDRRIAISGLIPDLPFTTLLRAWTGDTERLRASGYGESQRFEAIVANDATGMNGVFHGHRFYALMVIGQLNVKGILSFKSGKRCANLALTVTDQKSLQAAFQTGAGDSGADRELVAWPPNREP